MRNLLREAEHAPTPCGLCEARGRTNHPTYEDAEAQARMDTRETPLMHHFPEECPVCKGWVVRRFHHRQYQVIRYWPEKQEAVIMAQGDYKAALGHALHLTAATGPVLFEVCELPGALVHGFSEARVFWHPKYDCVHYVVDADTFPVQCEVFSGFEMLELPGMDRFDVALRKIGQTPTEVEG